MVSVLWLNIVVFGLMAVAIVAGVVALTRVARRPSKATRD
jgi:hypothetical protein